MSFSPYRDPPTRTKPECDWRSHSIVGLHPGQYEEPYKELHQFKCIVCGKTFPRDYLENVSGKWRMVDYSRFNKKRRGSRRNACSSSVVTEYFRQKNW